MTMHTDNKDSLLPIGGNYRQLITFQKAEAIYDITCYFCKNYLRRGDRTIDQMVQAARSGKQNIVEGSAVSSTRNHRQHGYLPDQTKRLPALQIIEKPWQRFS